MKFLNWMGVERGDFEAESWGSAIAAAIGALILAPTAWSGVMMMIGVM